MKLTFLMRPQEVLKGQANMRFMNFFCQNCQALKFFDERDSEYHRSTFYPGPAIFNSENNQSYCVKAAAATRDRHECIVVKHPDRWYKKL